MKAIALARIDPVLAGRVLAASVVLVALGSSQAILRFTRLLLEATWLYLSNTRG